MSRHCRLPLQLSQLLSIAFNLFQRSHDLLLTQAAKSDQRVLRYVDMLGYMLYATGNFEEAAELQEQNLKDRVSTLGDDHLETLESVASLAWLRQREGRWEEAIELHRQTREGRLALLGERHPSACTSSASLGLRLVRGSKSVSKLVKMLRLVEATPLLYSALKTRRDILGDCRPGTISSMREVAELEAAQSRYAQAERVWKEWLISPRTP